MLDRVRRHPAYVAYKQRIGELLEPTAGRYLDVGCGTGNDAVGFAVRYEVEVAGVDVSHTMVDEARRRGLADVQVADAHALPFAADTFDGCWADRTFQHLADPVVALAELVRVTKPGGRVVVADPDYDTQVVDIVDQELARRVLRFRADRLLRNGTLAHQMGRRFVDAGLGDVRVEVFPVVVRDPTELDHALGLRSWAAEAHERGLVSLDEVGHWEQALDEAVARGHFLYSFSVFVTAGRRPG